MRRTIFLLSLLLASCAQTREFEIRVIDVNRQPVDCLIVVDRQWPRQGEEPVWSDAMIDVEFERRTITVRVMPVQKDASGER